MAYKHFGCSSFLGDPRNSSTIRIKFGELREDGCQTSNGHIHKDAWDWWVDGYPVTAKLYEGIRELRKLAPRLKYMPACEAEFQQRGTNNAYVGNYAFTSMYAYVDTCDFALGRIGYGNFTGNPKREDQYMVYARFIKSERVKDNRDQHHMAFSKDPKKFAARAAKELRPYAASEYAKLYAPDFSSEIAERKRDIVSAPQSLLLGCSRMSVIETEIRNLIKLGVQFVTPEFRAAAEKFFELDAEAQAEKLQKRGAYFIRLYNDTMSGQAAQRAEVLTFSSTSLDPKTAEITTLDANDLPYDVQMSLATLSTMTNGSYAPGVGMRVKANRYWVERQL